MRAYLDKVLAEAIRAGQNPSEDPVHDMRVAIRRWGQALRVFDPLLPQGVSRKLRKGVRPLLDSAGATRDFDIGMDLLHKDGLRHDHPVFRTWELDRERASLAISGHVLLFRSGGQDARWRTIIDGAMPPSEPAATHARQVLPAQAQDFFETGRKAVQRSNDPARLHAFRLSAKRFRYTLEIFSCFYGPALMKRIESVREIQSILGKRQDCTVTAERIEPALQFDADLAEVHRRLITRGSRLEEQFLRYWHHAFDAPGELERWQRYLARRVPVRQ